MCMANKISIAYDCTYFATYVTYLYQCFLSLQETLYYNTISILLYYDAISVHSVGNKFIYYFV